MKYLKVLLLTAILGTSFMACSPKGHKHPLKQRSADMNAYGANGQWANFANSAYIQLNASDSAQRDFIADNFNTPPIGSIYGTEVAMQINLHNPTNSRLGILIWDEYAYQNYGYEFASYYGPENMGSVTASVSQQDQTLHAEFIERDTPYVVMIDARIFNNTMSGTIRYGYQNGGDVYTTLGTFENVPTQGVIY